MLQLLAAKSAAARPVLPPLLQHIAPVRAGVAIAHFAVLRSTLCWQTRMQLAAAATLACVALLTVSRRVAPGWRRFALLPPVLVVNILLPLLFDVQSELITRIAVTFLMTWLANFKVHGLVGVWMVGWVATPRQRWREHTCGCQADIIWARRAPCKLARMCPLQSYAHACGARVACQRQPRAPTLVVAACCSLLATTH
jgi:hypothetical protein